MRLIAIALAALGGSLAVSAAAAQTASETQTAPAAAAPPMPEMSFRRIEAPNLCRRCDVVQASGPIGPMTPLLFDEFLRRERIGGRPLHVIVDSVGGKVTAGWALGRRLRALSASVIAARAVERPDGAIELRPGSCISMCNSLLAAGVERRISPGTVFGVHQFSPTNEQFRNLDNAVTVRDMRGQLKMVAEWLAYAREMKIDQRLVEAQLNVPFEKVDFISHETLAAWRVVTAAGASLPKLLRNPRPGAEIAEAQPAAAQAQAAAPVPAGRQPDRQWSPPRANGDWRETNFESDADFLRVSVACSIQGRVSIQIMLRGAPEARQKAMAQQIIAAGGFDLIDRPVDISQIALGFGGVFWIRAALRPDQANRLLASQGRFSFSTGEGRDGARAQTTGFAENVAPMFAGCGGPKQSASVAPKP